MDGLQVRAVIEELLVARGDERIDGRPVGGIQNRAGLPPTPEAPTCWKTRSATSYTIWRLAPSRLANRDTAP